MSEFTDDQEIVLEIIKLWLREQDAAFLAREELVVFWGPLDGNLRKQGWNKLKLSEAVSIVRTTKVPVGVADYWYGAWIARTQATDRPPKTPTVGALCSNR